MSILAAVTGNTIPSGIRAIFSGAEKIGKTTLACNAPRPLLVPLEVGFGGVQVNKTPMLHHLDHVNTFLDEVIAACQTGTFPFKSIIFDSATALERLIHQYVLESDPAYGKGNKKAMTMESALGGYGKAYSFANELFDNFLKKCDLLAVNAGINIILTCHVFAAQIQDPSAGEYSSWDLLLHSPKNQKTYGKREMITQWSDLIGFIHEPVTVIEGEKGAMSKGVSTNSGRILSVVRTPGYVAGNRFHMVNDIKLPREHGWNLLAAEIYQNSGVDIYNRDDIV
jgi:hypothetical protein